MSEFEYIMVPLGIVLGLAIAHLLAGLGKTLYRVTQHGDPIRLSWVHTLWVLNTAFWMFAYWWYQFTRGATDTWPFEAYLFMIPLPVLFYLQSVVLFPNRFDEVKDVGEYFLSIRRWFFGLALLAILIEGAEAVVVQSMDYLFALGAPYAVLTATNVTICVVGSVTRNMRIQGGMAVTLLALQVWQMFQAHPFLGT